MAGKLDAANAAKAFRKRATLLREAIIAAQGITPLEYMLQVLRDPTATLERRDWAASAAAPYVHPKLQSIIHEGGDKPIQITEVRRVIVRA